MRQIYKHGAIAATNIRRRRILKYGPAPRAPSRVKPIEAHEKSGLAEIYRMAQIDLYLNMRLI